MGQHHWVHTYVPRCRLSLPPSSSYLLLLAPPFGNLLITASTIFRMSALVSGASSKTSPSTSLPESSLSVGGSSWCWRFAHVDRSEVLAFLRYLGVDCYATELDEGFCCPSSVNVTLEFEIVSAATCSFADDLVGLVHRLVAFFFDFFGMIWDCTIATLLLTNSMFSLLRMLKLQSMPTTAPINAHRLIYCLLV